MTTLRDSLKDNKDPNEKKDNFKNRVSEFKEDCSKIISRKPSLPYCFDRNIILFYF